ncbi:N-acetylmuramoyl-L-alanine amidase [Arenibaculum pallidiluteum]|uniref:N-acetylmuramoyl-L-alanine amidase n=1 Tax=Arenibaculum pallidiluteum TaxID=2812559 RepID=UPI001F2AD520|nr:N-acetylmuramoyl-L-alanine amidase [Arenibaculum pallidiluteum]
MIDLPSPNHGPRRADAPIDILLLHYTGMPDARSALDRLRDPGAEVSAHYVVGEDGMVWAMVPEDRRAWHAGRSFWQGERDVNSRSIGVEIVNPGHEWGYRPFPAAQMEAVAELARGIIARHGIPPARVLGHSDVAPARKEDPGELFDWRDLAARGVGHWPDRDPGEDGSGGAEEAHRLLLALGYDPECPPPLLVRAFHRRYRPEALDAPADADTLRLLRALARSGAICS